MAEFIREHATGLMLSLLVHAAIAAVLVVGFAWQTPPAALPMASTPVVQATVIDQSRIEEELRKIERAEQQERERKQAEARKVREQAEQARKAREAEEARLIALKKKREEQERLAKAEAEARERQRKEEAEKQRLAEAERKRKEEQQRQAKLEKERKEAEERRRKEAEARQRQEAEALLRQQLAAEEARMAAERSGLLAQYIALVQQKIERNWIRPPSARPGLECIVRVAQIPGGEVVSVQVVKCNGDEAVVRSIENAVYKASPLPDPADPSLFERNLQLVFKPRD